MTENKDVDGGKKFTGLKLRHKEKKSGFSEKHVKQLVSDFKSMCAMCEKPTEKSFGQGAHIISLCKKGPRSYKTYEQYSDLDDLTAEKIFGHNTNGLWLCYDCHRKIDKVELVNYSAEKLYCLRAFKIAERKHILDTMNYTEKKMEIEFTIRSIIDRIDGEEEGILDYEFNKKLYRYINDKSLSDSEWLESYKNILYCLIECREILQITQLCDFTNKLFERFEKDKYVVNCDFIGDLIGYIDDCTKADLGCRFISCDPLLNIQFGDSTHVLKIYDLYRLIYSMKDSYHYRKRIDKLLDDFIRDYGIKDKQILDHIADIKKI
jgi:hypothetical protein